MASVLVILHKTCLSQFYKIIFLVFLLSMAYWLGRRSCNVDNQVYFQEVRRSTEYSEKEIQHKTAKFNREARKQAMERCCQRRDSSRALTLKEEVNVFTHVIVDRKNKLLYCYIPKVASSNMKRLMLTLQNFTNDSNLIKHFNKQGFEYLSDVDPTERVAMLKSYFKFMFVRNPQLRLVSAFKNKFLKPNTAFQLMYGQNIVFRYRRPSMPRNLIKGDDVTFQEFTRYLVDKNHDMLTTNEHWMPMYNLCQPCYIKYDFIGSFEELALDTSALLKQIRAPKHASFPRKQKATVRPSRIRSTQIFIKT